MESQVLIPTIVADSLWNPAVSLDLQAFSFLPFRGRQSFLLYPLPRLLWEVQWGEACPGFLAGRKAGLR